MRVRIEKHWREEKEMNGKHEEGGFKGLRKDWSCLIIRIIICNHLPPTTRVVRHRGVIPVEEKRDKNKGGSERPKKGLRAFSFHLCLVLKERRSWREMHWRTERGAV